MKRASEVFLYIHRKINQVSYTYEQQKKSGKDNGVGDEKKHFENESARITLVVEKRRERQWMLLFAAWSKQ